MWNTWKFSELSDGTSEEKNSSFPQENLMHGLQFLYHFLYYYAGHLFRVILKGKRTEISHARMLGVSANCF